MVTISWIQHSFAILERRRFDVAAAERRFERCAAVQPLPAGRDL
jgi:hypothetical protein